MKFAIASILMLLMQISLFAQNFEIYKGDTINYIDKNKLKQGVWIFFADQAKTKITQKGTYKNNLKEGTWTTYFTNGKVSSIVNFQQNKQIGNAKIYYENGQIQEEGYWKLNKWIGEYNYYYDNGQVKYHWFFDDNGQRTGKQQYFFDNGQKQIEGEWTQGKESGQIKEYYSNGTVSQVANFENGSLNGTMTQYFDDGKIKTKVVYVQGKADPDQSYVYKHSTTNNNDNDDDKYSTVGNDLTKDSTANSQNYKLFNGNGFYKFINDKGLVDREGTFQNGVLVEGKKYFYNSDGKKTKTAIISGGRIVQIINE